MALLTDRYDSGRLVSALRNNSQLAGMEATQKARTRSMENSTLLTRRNIARSERDINLIAGIAQKSFSAVISAAMGNFAPMLGDDLNSLIQSSQLQQANAELYPLLLEGAGIAQESLASGESRFQQMDFYDSDGNVTRSETVFMPGESLQAWYDDAMKKVDDMGFLPNVKSQLKSSLTSSYYGQLADLQSSAIEKAYTDMQNAYATNLNNALTADAALWNQYDGDPLSSGITFQGMAIIAGRSDLSPEARQTEAVNYLNQVRRLATQEKAVELARTEGMASVDAYLAEQTWLQPTERNSYYQIAQTSFSQMAEAYTGQGTQMMREAFDDGESMPIQVYTAIDDFARSNGLSESAHSALRDGARAEQRLQIADMAANSLAADRADGYQAMIDGRDYIKDGKADAYLAGLPDDEAKAIKATLVGQYDSAIAEYEESTAKALGKSIEDIRAADKNLLQSFNSTKAALSDSFLGGSITGHEYAQGLRTNVQATLDAMGEEGGENWNGVIAAYESGMKAMTESEVLKPHKGDIEEAVENVLVSEGRIAYSGKDRDKEEWDIYYRTLDEVNGLLYEAAMNYGTGKLTLEEFYRTADRANQAIILSHSMASDMGIKSDGSQTYKEVIQNFTKQNNAAYAASNSQIPIIRRTQTLAADGSVIEGYEFPVPELEAEFGDNSDVLTTLVSKMEGVPRESIQCSPQYNEATGTMIAAPVASVMYGEGEAPAAFRAFGDVLQKRVDFGNGISAWVDYASINGGYPEKFPQEDFSSKSEKAKEAAESGQDSLDVSRYIRKEGGRWTVDKDIFDDPFYDYKTAYQQIQRLYRGEWDLVLNVLSNAALEREVM